MHGVKKVAPHQFGQMTYSRALELCAYGPRSARGRKSWPHVLSPEGRGGGGRQYRSHHSGPQDWAAALLSVGKRNVRARRHRATGPDLASVTRRSADAPHREQA